MRILYHHRTQAEDAQGIHIHEMVTAFRELGHDVTMAALLELDQTGNRKTRGVHWKWLSGLARPWLYELLAIVYNLYGYWRLRRAIRSQRPDLIYERYSLHTFCGIWASHRFSIPLVLEVNAPLAYEQERLGRLTFKRLARLSERWICSHSTRTIVVSHAMKQMLIHEGVPAPKLAVLPNGVDPRVYYPGVPGEAVRQRYGLDSKVVVGCVGWFRKWHGVELLLQSLDQSGLASRGAIALLVGDGPACRELKDYTESHGLQSHVIFTGAVGRSEIPAHIAAMDIVVQPAATEYASPMKLFEYMAMGKCVVAPDQPNIREIVEEGTGFLFKPGDQESLHSILLRLVDDPTARREAGRRAHQCIHERGFLWQANAQRAIALIGKSHTAA